MQRSHQACAGWVRAGAAEAGAGTVGQAAGLPGAARRAELAAPAEVHAGSPARSPGGAEHAASTEMVAAAAHASAPAPTAIQDSRCGGCAQCSGPPEGLAGASGRPAVEAHTEEACASDSVPAARSRQAVHIAHERSFQAVSSSTAPEQHLNGAQPSRTPALEPTREAESSAPTALDPSAAAAADPQVAGLSQQHILGQGPQQHMVEIDSVAALAAAASMTAAASNEHTRVELASSQAPQVAPASQAPLPAALEQLQEIARAPTAALCSAPAACRDAPQECPSARAQCHARAALPAASLVQTGHQVMQKAEQRPAAGHAEGHRPGRQKSFLQSLCLGSAASSRACMAPCQHVPSAPGAVREPCIPGTAANQPSGVSAPRASAPRASAAGAWLTAAFASAWGADTAEAGAAAPPSASGRRRPSALPPSVAYASASLGPALTRAAQRASTVSPAAAPMPASCRGPQWRAGTPVAPRIKSSPPGQGWRPLSGRSGMHSPGGQAEPRLALWQPGAAEAVSTVNAEGCHLPRAASKRSLPGSALVGLALPESVAALEALAQS